MQNTYTLNIKTLDQDFVEINIQGELCINNSEQLLNDLLPLSTNKNINLKISNITNIDLAGLQIIYSLKRSCNNHNKNIEIELDKNKKIESLLSNSGFNIN